MNPCTAWPALPPNVDASLSMSMSHPISNNAALVWVAFFVAASFCVWCVCHYFGDRG